MYIVYGVEVGDCIVGFGGGDVVKVDVCIVVG